ncbi:MAG: T9SS type A sorting domain-containing protein [Candidatus Cloacimonetes bacterium]|nr:T9SS type A sorting domain-containing protein [Candidatus Cloacimonadota bacterium]
MKKVLLLMWLITAIALMGEVGIDFAGDRVTINGSFELDTITVQEIDGEIYNQVQLQDCQDGGEPGRAMIPHFTKMLVLPNTGNWVISEFNYETEELKLEHPLAWHGIGEQDRNTDSSDWYPENLVTIGDPIIMRQIRFGQVSLSAMQYNAAENKIRIITNFDLILQVDNTRSGNAKSSSGATSGSSFSELADSIYGYSSDRGEEKGSYLIICPDNTSVINTLEYLAEWKRRLGFETTIATLDETGDTTDDIKDYIQNAYETWETPPEYVILVGDVTGNIIIPSWYIAGYLEPYCVTDHPYTLLEGVDYFPDIQIGRFSVQSVSQLQTIVSKVINYEREPLETSDWIRRALMLTFVMDYGGSYQMYSQRETVMAIRDKLLDFTYTEVDTFICPFQTGITNLTNLINTGYSFVNYRGAGSPVYWSGGYDHMFTLWDIDQLSNSSMLPLVTSIVCGGGNFAYGNYDTCFGEQWLAAGSSSNPKGAIGFIGPSEHDTKTPFNNCNDMGIYQGITQEGISACAPIMLRGKMELYNNYPGCHQMDGVNDAWDSDMFYFYVYNLLGDPGLKVWTDTPKHYNVQMAESLPLGSSSYEVNLEGDDLAGHTVALTSGEVLYEVSETNMDGWAAVTIPDGLTAFEVTLSKYGYVPFSQAVSISTEEQIVGLVSYDYILSPVSGGTTELTIGLVNLTPGELSGLEVELISADELVTVETGIQTIETMGIGAVVELEYDLEFSDIWRENESALLLLKINNGVLGEHNISCDVASADLQYAGRTVMNTENCLLIGEANDLELELYNSGRSNSEAFTAVLANLDGKCEIISSDCTFPDISPGETETGNGVFGFTLDNDLIDGEPIDFNLTIIQGGNQVWETNFTLEAGIVGISSPTYSNYGYFAIENSDSGNFTPPVYDWMEINPNLGGNGNLIPASHVTSDGFSTCIPLPFEFCYYGQFYNEITVSSSGWLAMGEEEYVFFRNRTIPSGVGVPAMIAPFWDYLTDGEIYSWYNEFDHCIYFEWFEFRDDYQHQDQTFQVILYDPLYYPTATGDGEIKFQYQEIHNVDQQDQFATIGIENYAQTEGLLLSFANIYPETMHPVSAGTAILFTINEGITAPRLSTDTAELHFNMQPDEIEEFDIDIFNISELFPVEYDLTISHFPTRENIELPDRDISGDSVNPVNQTYYTGHEMNLYAFMIHDDIDGEPVAGVEVDFPDYVEVTSATDIGPMNYNGQTGSGATVTWGYGNGNSYYGNTPQTFHVYFIVDPSISAPVPINWRLDGDGLGSDPHTVTGTLTLMPSSETYIWVEYPNGGEELTYGITDTIRWSSYGDISNVDVFYTNNNFVNYDMLATDLPNVGELEWTVPSELTETGKIRVKDSSSNEYDNSDNVFAIRGLTITYPTDSSVMEYGALEEIRWDFAGNVSSVDIDYSTTGGFYWETLVNDTPNTGSYEFIVNIPPTNNAKVRIIAYGEELMISEMDGEFSIIDVPVNWLTLENYSGIINPQETTSLPLTIDTAGMPYGEYLAYLTIVTEYNQKLSIPIYLEIPNLAVDENNIPAAAVLKNNYPNPFGDSNTRSSGTNFAYNLSLSGHVKLAIYNLRGQMIRLLIDENKGVGNYSFHWDGMSPEGLPLAAGVYFYQLELDSKVVATKKCLLLK